MSQSPEVPKLMWTMDLKILQDPSRPFDRGYKSIDVKIMWEPMCRVTRFPVVPLRVACTGTQETLKGKLRALDLWVVVIPALIDSSRKEELASQNFQRAEVPKYI
jgi:hypothetical protein